MRFCPKASPTEGMNPGNDMEYWFVYEKLALRTSMSPRATACMVRYHFLLSSGSMGVTVILSFSAESTLLRMLSVLLSVLRKFSL